MSIDEAYVIRVPSTPSSLIKKRIEFPSQITTKMCLTDMYDRNKLAHFQRTFLRQIILYACLFLPFF